MFYDADNDGTFLPGCGDFALSDTQVEVTYTYPQLLTDMEGTPIRDTEGKLQYQAAEKTETVTTDSLGTYRITGIPIVEGEESRLQIRVVQPSSQYEVTTNDVSTNGGLTNGTAEQTLLLQEGMNKLSDAGFYYPVEPMPFHLTKEWSVDKSIDTNQPLSVTVTYSIGYWEEALWHETERRCMSLSEAEAWTKTEQNLPSEYVDAEGSLHPLELRLLTEAYVMRDGTHDSCELQEDGTYTYTENGIAVTEEDYPYRTSFEVTAVSGGYQGTVRNSAKTAVYQVTKRDLSDSDKLLAGAVFRLYTYQDGDPTNTDPENLVPLGEQTTNIAGIAAFQGLEVGHYYVVEVTAPENYILEQSKYSFQLSEDGSTALGRRRPLPLPAHALTCSA